MKSLKVSSKYLIILFMILVPIGILVYKFLDQQNEAITSIQKQIVKLEKIKKEVSSIDSELSKSLTSPYSYSEFQFQSKIQKLEHLGLESRLLFESNLFSYYLIQISLVKMPKIYENLFRSSQNVLRAGRYMNWISLAEQAAQTKSLLGEVSTLSSKVINLNTQYKVPATFTASVRSEMYSYLKFIDDRSITINNLTAVIKTLESEKKNLFLFWTANLDLVEFDLNFRQTQLQNQQKGYMAIFLLLFLTAIVVTLKIFLDISQRIQKLTVLTQMTDPHQLTIQSSDFGYDEIGQLAQSFHTMSLILKENYEKIEKANSAKSLFVANVSHEIRTPINGIIGMTKIMQQTSLSMEQQEHLQVIEKSSEILLILINDILDLSKIESNKMNLETTSFYLNDSLQDVVDCLAHLGKQKGLQISLTPAVENYFVAGDVYKLKQVLFNLMSNAIKFTDHGTVSLFFEKINENPDSVHFKIGVRDQGVGIAEEKLKFLFEDFVQADASTTRKHGGTGLGLSLSKKLIHLMGGEIFVSSRLGEGSCFWFEIQLPRVGETYKIPKVKTFAQPGFKKLKVLIVEDNSVNMFVLQKYLQSLGHDHVSAENGQQAIEKLKRCNDIDLILMDCQMPMMDGYEATRFIRKLTEPHLKNVKIIALTANALLEDEKKCIDAGMDQYMTKPIDFEKLKEVLSVPVIQCKAS